MFPLLSILLRLFVVLTCCRYLSMSEGYQGPGELESTFSQGRFRQRGTYPGVHPLSPSDGEEDRGFGDDGEGLVTGVWN